MISYLVSSKYYIIIYDFMTVHIYQDKSDDRII